MTLCEQWMLYITQTICYFPIISGGKGNRNSFLLLTTIYGKRGQFFLEISVPFDFLNRISVFLFDSGLQQGSTTGFGISEKFSQILLFHSIPRVEFVEVWVKWQMSN